MNNFIESQTVGVCRTCAIESKNLKSLFTLEHGTTFAEMLYYCTQLSIYDTNERPTGICQLCIPKLNSSFEFCKLVRNSEEKFAVQYANKLKNSIETPDERAQSTPLDFLKVEEIDEVENQTNQTIFVEPIVEQQDSIALDDSKQVKITRKGPSKDKESHRKLAPPENKKRKGKLSKIETAAAESTSSDIKEIKTKKRKTSKSKMTISSIKCTEIELNASVKVEDSVAEVDPISISK